MRLKILILACLASLLCATTSAQAYSVRVTFNTNLRASYSLSARVLDTAPAGVALNVAGSHENWLRVDWMGRQMWLAGWVPMTRLDAPQSSANIDNCCYVDRQCASDHDWTAGYWAYQNNQCGAPATTEALTPAQPETSVPENVDNCCFVDRQCRTDHEWTQGFWDFQNHQCGAPGSHARAVQVEGSAGFIHMVDRAFQLLQEWAPEWYTYVVSALSKVRQDPGSPSSGIYIDSRTYGVGTNIQTIAEVSSYNVVDMVGGLAHEACHVHQWWDGTATAGWRNEIGCLHAQLAATEAVDPLDRQSPWLRDLIANIENPEYWWWTD